MASASIPNYPVINVDVRADGSAHVNVAGRHLDFPAGPVATTRVAVIRYAVDVAIALGRPVRMTSTGRDGTWKLAVHPNGSVSDLTEASSKREQGSAARTSAVAFDPRMTDRS